MKKFFISFVLFLFCLPIFADHPRVALVLSGGGAKGYVHIATIEMIEKYGIPVDYVVGTSMGALVGGLYSMGYSSSDMIDVVRSSDVENSVFNFDTASVVPAMLSSDVRKNFSIGMDSNGITSLTGVVNDTDILNILSSLTVKQGNINNFDEFKKSFRAVAVDFYSGDVVPLKDGSIVEAMRASMSIPIAFPVFKVKDRYLVDGGVKENIPLQIAKDEFNPDIIIVSDCTGVRFRKAKGSDILTKLDDGTIGIVDVVSHSVALGGVITEEKQQNIRDSVDLHVEYDTSPFSTSSFSSFEKILSSSRTTAMLLEDKFKALAEQIASSNRAMENVNLKEESYYSSLPFPKVSTVEIVGDESYRSGLNRELYNAFKEFENCTLDRANIDKLEVKIKDAEMFFRMAYIYYILEKQQDGSNKLQIKYRLYPIRKNNLLLDVDIKTSLNMVNYKNIPGSSYNTTEFGFSFNPNIDLSYRAVLSPYTSLNNLGVRFQSGMLLKDNKLSVDYEYIFNPGNSYTWYLNPSIDLYAGIAAPNRVLTNTSWFSGYDYGISTSVNAGYYSLLSNLRISLSLDYMYFGYMHESLSMSTRRNALGLNLSLNLVFGRKEYHSLSTSTGYRVQVSLSGGFDFGKELLNGNYISSTIYPYSFLIRTDGTIQLLPRLSIMINAEGGVSRKAGDLFNSYNMYGGVKGMPGFSIADIVFDYYNIGINFLIPFTTNKAFYPMFIMRAAIGGYDKYSINAYSDKNNEPYNVFEGNFVPFSSMNGMNIGVGAYFGYHTPFIDLIVGVGYEFIEKRVSVNIELW